MENNASNNGSKLLRNLRKGKRIMLKGFGNRMTVIPQKIVQGSQQGEARIEEILRHRGGESWGVPCLKHYLDETNLKKIFRSNSDS